MKKLQVIGDTMIWIPGHDRNEKTRQSQTKSSLYSGSEKVRSGLKQSKTLKKSIPRQAIKGFGGEEGRSLPY